MSTKKSKKTPEAHPAPAHTDTSVPKGEKWPPKAYNNTQFLFSPEARSLRVQCELEEPAYRLRNMGVRNTIVFFGSARSVNSKDAAVKAKAIEHEIKTNPGMPDREKEALLRKAGAIQKLAKYYDAADELAYEMTKWSASIQYPHKRFYVCSGGGPGMMEAANRGAQRAGGRSLGLGISLPFEQGINEYVTPELAFEFHYFFVRKYWFLYLAKALILFPGGFGTMDEFFEILTLIQTQKVKRKLPIILFGSEFWRDVLHFESFERWGVISPEDLELFKISDSIEETRDYLIGELDQSEQM